MSFIALHEARETVLHDVHENVLDSNTWIELLQALDLIQATDLMLTMNENMP